MSNRAVYERAIPNVDGRPWDIVVSAHGLNGAIPSPHITNAITNLFLEVVASVNGVNRDAITAEHLNTTVLTIEENDDVHIEIDNDEIDLGTLPNLNINETIAGINGRTTAAVATLAIKRLHLHPQMVHMSHDGNLPHRSLPASPRASPRLVAPLHRAPLRRRRDMDDSDDSKSQSPLLRSRGGEERRRRRRRRQPQNQPIRDNGDNDLRARLPSSTVEMTSTPPRAGDLEEDFHF